MYQHPEALHREQDARRAAEVACELHKLRAEAAQRVPGWSPEMRAELRKAYRRSRSRYYY